MKTKSLFFTVSLLMSSGIASAQSSLISMPADGVSSHKNSRLISVDRSEYSEWYYPRVESVIQQRKKLLNKVQASSVFHVSEQERRVYSDPRIQFLKKEFLKCEYNFNQFQSVKNLLKNNVVSESTSDLFSVEQLHQMNDHCFTVFDHLKSLPPLDVTLNHVTQRCRSFYNNIFEIELCVAVGTEEAIRVMKELLTFPRE